MFFRQKERKVDAKLEFHLESMVEEYVKQGMTLEQARRRARIEFGGPQQIKEEIRDGCVATFDWRSMGSLKLDGETVDSASSGSQFEECVDELNLTPNIRSAHPPNLS